MDSDKKCNVCGKPREGVFSIGLCSDCENKARSASKYEGNPKSPETTVKEGSDAHASDIVSLSQNQVEFSFSGVQWCLILSGGFLALILLISGLWYVGQFSYVVKNLDSSTKMGAELQWAAFQNLIGLAFLRFAQVGFTAAITWALVILLGKFDQK